MNLARHCCALLVAAVSGSALLVVRGAHGPGVHGLAAGVAMVGFGFSVQLWRARSFPGSLYFAWALGVLVVQVIADAAVEPVAWKVVAAATATGLLLFGLGRVAGRSVTGLEG